MTHSSIAAACLDFMRDRRPLGPRERRAFHEAARARTGDLRETGHAREQMEVRDLTLNHVFRVLEHGQPWQRAQWDEAHHNWKVAVDGPGPILGGRAVRIVLAPGRRVGEVCLVTVMWVDETGQRGR